MKRILALVLALVLLCGCALADSSRPASIATYTLPVGSEAVHLMDADAWDVPEGLEVMYAMMKNADPTGNIYLTRMKHGRALVSVACSTPKNIPDMQQLQAMWYDSISQTIADEENVMSVYCAEDSAKLTERFGFEALQINTTLEESAFGMAYEAEGIAFVRGKELLEIWAVAPAAEAYAQDEAAAKELASDRADMEMFLKSLNFSAEQSSQAVRGVTFFDPEGRFNVMLPADCTILTQHSGQQEIDRAREAYLAAHPDGGEGLFNEYLKDIEEQQVVVFISADQQLAAEIFAAQEEDFRDVTVEQLRQLANPIARSLAERFDVALLLDDSETVTLDGHDHAALTYWVREGDANVQLDVLASVLDDAWLYEVDIYTHNGDQDLRSLWSLFIRYTIKYTPLVNALD